jgi:hypothetical protein
MTKFILTTGNIRGELLKAQQLVSGNHPRADVAPPE